ncbi:MAG: hypothetical protein AAF800_05260 [Planctomycetota bacterium]
MMTTAFLNNPYFYSLALIGAMAMLPRARYAADRAAALTPEAGQHIKPNFAQRVCLFIPGLCLFACIGMFGYVLGAMVLLAVYVAVFIVMIQLFKQP